MITQTNVIEWLLHSRQTRPEGITDTEWRRLSGRRHRLKLRLARRIGYGSIKHAKSMLARLGQPVVQKIAHLDWDSGISPEMYIDIIKDGNHDVVMLALLQERNQNGSLK